MTNDLTAALIGLGGAVVGGVLVIIGQYLQDSRDRTARKTAVAHSIAAEIEAYLDLMKRRNHVAYAQQIIDANKRGVKSIPKDWISGFERELEPFPIMRSALPEVGLLGSLGGDVAKFYTQTNAIRITIMGADDGKYDNATAADLAYIFEQELKLWNDTEELGRTVIKVLRSY